jgi:hypothetical protein
VGLFDRGHRGTLGRWSLRWLVLMSLWLALTDTRVVPELVTGAVAAAIGATASGLVTRPGRPRTIAKSLALARLGPRRLVSPLLRLAPDTVLVAGALWRRLVLRRPVQGSFRVARLGSEHGRRSAAARVLTEVWASLVPNRYIVGADEEDGIILVHELVPTDEPVDPLARR